MPGASCSTTLKHLGESPLACAFQRSQLAASSQATDAGKLSRITAPHADVMLSQANDNKERRTMQTKTVLAVVPFAAPVPSSATLFHRIWPPAVLVLGIVLTLAWTALL